jgi:hypothetical protein
MSRCGPVKRRRIRMPHSVARMPVIASHPSADRTRRWNVAIVP